MECDTDCVLAICVKNEEEEKWMVTSGQSSPLHKTLVKVDKMVTTKQSWLFCCAVDKLHMASKDCVSNLFHILCILQSWKPLFEYHYTYKLLP